MKSHPLLDFWVMGSRSLEGKLHCKLIVCKAIFFEAATLAAAVSTRALQICVVSNNNGESSLWSSCQELFFPVKCYPSSSFNCIYHLGQNQFNSSNPSLFFPYSLPRNLTTCPILCHLMWISIRWIRVRIFLFNCSSVDMQRRLGVLSWKVLSLFICHWSQWKLRVTQHLTGTTQNLEGLGPRSLRGRVIGISCKSSLEFPLLQWLLFSKENNRTIYNLRNMSIFSEGM